MDIKLGSFDSLNFSIVINMEALSHQYKTASVFAQLRQNANPVSNSWHIF